MNYTKDQVALACLSCGVPGDTIKRILELLPDGETPSLPGQPDRLFYSVPEEKMLGTRTTFVDKMMDDEREANAAICEFLALILEQGEQLTKAEAALEKAGRQITGVVGPDGC